MQIKIDFLCRDSILAAPLVLDLVLFMDLAQRAGMRGVQEWLSFYFKAPMTAPGLYPEHDIFIQLMKLKNTLRWMQGEDADHAPRPGILRLTSSRARCMKVLVIGGTLFIGRLLVAELLKAGHRVAILHRKLQARLRQARARTWWPTATTRRRCAARHRRAPFRSRFRQRVRLGARHHGRAGGSHRARHGRPSGSATFSCRAWRLMATA